jgi:malonate transporter MadL subunit
MIIYGTSILAICYLFGVWLGMMLLIGVRFLLHKHNLMTPVTEAGVGFWAAMYIPVVVAMAAQQNVVAALKGGPVALVAALATFALCVSVIAFINRATSKGQSASWQESSAPEKH